MKPQAYRAPSVLETIRLDLTVLERAHAAGDIGTAKRCVDAAEAMFVGLRDVLAAGGTDTGPAVWNTPLEDWNQRDAEAMAGSIGRIEVPPREVRPPLRLPPTVDFLPTVLKEIPPADVASHWRLVVRRDYGWRTLGWLVWLTAACVAAMFLKTVRR